MLRRISGLLALLNPWGRRKEKGKGRPGGAAPSPCAECDSATIKWANAETDRAERWRRRAAPASGRRRPPCECCLWSPDDNPWVLHPLGPRPPWPDQADKWLKRRTAELEAEVAKWRERAGCADDLIRMFNDDADMHAENARLRSDAPGYLNDENARLRSALYGLWTGVSDGVSLGDMAPRMREAERILLGSSASPICLAGDEPVPSDADFRRQLEALRLLGGGHPDRSAEALKEAMALHKEILDDYDPHSALRDAGRAVDAAKRRLCEEECRRLAREQEGNP